MRSALPPPSSESAGMLVQVAQALPGVAAMAVFAGFAYYSGGFFPHVWYAGALVLIAIVVVAFYAAPTLAGRVGAATGAAIVALAAFTAWSYLSVLWADVPGDAWDGANRTVLYLVVFALFALWRWSTAAAAGLLGAFAAGTCALGLLAVADAAISGDAAASYINGRFTQPIGYVNGNAALFVLAFWPAFFLASRRELPLPARGLSLAAAGMLLQLAVLPQSRGVVLAFVVTLLAYFALVPGRVRSFVFLLPIAAAVAIAAPSLLATDAVTPVAELEAAARYAAAVLGVTGVTLLALGVALAAADRRIQVAERTRRRAGWALAAALATAAVAGAGILFATVDVGARASSAWDDLFTPSAQPAAEGPRLLSGLQTNRGDLWRVALDEFREHPVGGIGVENYGVAYVRERRSDEETLYPHSFPLQVLAQTGLVGTALMVFFLAAAGYAALGAIRRGRGLARGVSAVATVVFLSWFVHASIEWFWELPALTAPALASLALAGSGTAAAPSRRARLVRPATAGACLLLAAVFAPPWLAALETRRAAAEWRVEPERAAARLDRARRLNPLTDVPDLVSGSIARRRENWDAMAGAYERALERNPHSWYSRLQLALARAKQGRREEAAAELRRARRLNPREPVLDLVDGWLRRGDVVNVAEVAQILLSRYAAVTGVEPGREPTRQP